jgi:hypothetical protein
MNQDQTQDIEAAEQAENATTASNIRRALGAMLIAMVFLALLNSAGFTTYARDLPGNEFSDWLVSVADQWNELMIQVGVTTVADDIREFFLSLKETEW